MQYKYSSSTNLFYVVGLHKDIPEDARDVAKETYDSIMNGSGKWIPDESGDPVEVQRDPVFFTLEQLAQAAMAQVNTEYIKRMGAVASPYPLHERESWPIQLAEAQTVLLYQGGELPEGVTSTWIDQCAHQRGMTRLELAQRIVAKDTAYRTVSGFLSGVRQWHEDCIDLLLQEGEGARDELQAYDHLQGWERAEEQLAT
ncbi:UNVERIFIED_ORG: hypothetical protein HNP28_003927 [Comamonas terrigena]